MKKAAPVPIREVTISVFRANCFAILDEVQKTKQAILVTRFGKPIAEVRPPSPSKEKETWLGSMAGEIEFLGDIVSPLFEESDWKESDG